MDNNEVLHSGKSIGYVGKDITPIEAEVTHIGEDYCKVEYKGDEYELPLVVAKILGGVSKIN